MVQLADGDIKTREVLDWKGLHVFHFVMSSCSQKLRIALNLKGVEWESHPIVLRDNENLSEWFLGINPRGLLPVLVHDGAVHIESNDILTYLDKTFPEPRLIPPGMEDEVGELLHHEDDLHLDLRTLSFRFVFPPRTTPKTSEDLQRYATTGSGTVQGKADSEKAKQIAFWQTFADHGITDEAAQISANRFRVALDELAARKGDSPYLLGETLSLLDIAWFIYVNRLLLGGYPLARLHPGLVGWFEGLKARPEFAREVALPDGLNEALATARSEIEASGRTLEAVAAL